ncbi:hypothetical protein V8D89_006804 [Ganoderma adspersum]
MSENHGAPDSAGPPPGSPHGSSFSSHPLSRPRSETRRSQSAVQSRIELLHQILEEAIAGKISDKELADYFQNLQATPKESSDIFNKLGQRRQQQQQGGRPEGGGQRPGNTEEGRSDPAEMLPSRIGWELLRGKLNALHADSSGEHDVLDLLVSLHDDEDHGAIPRAVLEVAPYLADIGSSSDSDKHIAKTLEIQETMSKEKVADRVITRLQLTNLADPLPKSIWHDIVTDKFVHFKKVFAAIDSAFNYDDEPKDFHRGYVLVKRDQFCTWKLLESEGD